MKTTNYTMEIVANKIENEIFNLDKKLSKTRTKSVRLSEYAKTIGTIEAIILNAKAQNGIK